MAAKLYKIKCLTNLHVGNGDVNFNIVDNEVERDPVTNYPTINASGVKGALREHFESVLGKTDDSVKVIFGKATDKKEETCQGKVKIFNANMVGIPMRVSNGNMPYVLVTTKCAIETLKNLKSALGIKGDIEDSQTYETKMEIEGVNCCETINIFGEEFYIMDEEKFKNISLPVSARNCLESGRENLWYEEIVPHESVMYFIASSNDEVALQNFDSFIKNNNIVPFGGNASIGYGVCKVEEVLSQ